MSAFIECTSIEGKRGLLNVSAICAIAEEGNCTLVLMIDGIRLNLSDPFDVVKHRISDPVEVKRCQA